MVQGIDQNTVAEALSLEPSAILEFYLIYYGWPADQNNFLAVTPLKKEVSNATIVWQGQSYISWPLETTGFGSKGDNSLPRPRIKLNNYELAVSKYLKTYNNLIGAKVIRKRTFAKFLDDTNFSSGKNPYYDLATNATLANSNSHLPDQTFYVNRRVSETKDIVELELSTVFELDNVYLPNRNVYSKYCTWVYRGNGCRYAGKPKTAANSQSFIDTAGNTISQSNLSNEGKWSVTKTYNRGDYVFVEIDNYILKEDSEKNLNAGVKLRTYYVCLTSNISGQQHFPPTSKHWARDECAKKISSCKLRFTAELPFGGFPGTHAYPPKG